MSSGFKFFHRVLASLPQMSGFFLLKGWIAFQCVVYVCVFVWICVYLCVCVLIYLYIHWDSYTDSLLWLLQIIPSLIWKNSYLFKIPICLLDVYRKVGFLDYSSVFSLFEKNFPLQLFYPPTTSSQRISFCRHGQKPGARVSIWVSQTSGRIPSMGHQSPAASQEPLASNWVGNRGGTSYQIV